MGLRGSNGEKERGQLRFCCDFHYLNAVTIKDAYPIPRIDESLSKLGDAKFFTTLDLGSAFWQVPLRKKDRKKTGFACEVGLYQWKMMPFGLCNATATFQRLMAQALTRVTKKYGNLVMCYVDDVVIATPTLEDHIDRLDEAFGCIKKSRLEMQNIEMRNLQGFSQVSRKNGGQAWREAGPGSKRGCVDMEGSQN